MSEKSCYSNSDNILHFRDQFDEICGCLDIINSFHILGAEYFKVPFLYVVPCCSAADKHTYSEQHNIFNLIIPNKRTAAKTDK